ncbi:MAG: HypC/HybG/HupF family hydrogenase formation chaperone [Acidobacteriota bacterium]|nr:HypC/HybG/HupF family hydrogenase formation chaperone [Acidobacteriota bacterium]
MCLGVPGKILELEGAVAQVDFFGLQRQVRLDLVDQPVAVGDYVLNHAGYAIRRIPEEEIQETLELYELLLAAAEEEDMMAEDVRGEMAAGGEVPS